jgi:hypothetical protein
MFSRAATLVATVALVVTCTYAGDAEVLSLTSKTFPDVIKGDLTLVKFFAPYVLLSIIADLNHA